MTKRTFYGFLIACSVILNIVFIGMWIMHAVPRHFMSYCQGESEENHHGKCPMQQALSMNDSQWTRLHPSIKSLRETTSGLYQELAKDRMTLVNELEKTPTDSAALSACRERIIARQKKIQELVTNHILEEKNMLTPKQQTRFFNTIRSNMSCGGMPGLMGMAPLERGEHPDAETMPLGCGKLKDTAGECGRYKESEHEEKR